VTTQGQWSGGSTSSPQGWITIEGAKQNNLKNIDLKIPLGTLTVITGVSGSGKSSLAFDILYAEGQRRYVESFSAYARQFLERMDKPTGIPDAPIYRRTAWDKGPSST
jgi:excinuclease UvrABC ATPase subunit